MSAKRLTSPETLHLERTPLGRQIADAIRSDILFGRLQPGEHVSQQQLCERYGTSRMPVRDALRQLTYEGFVLGDDGRHSTIAPFSRSDLQDIYIIEGMLHALALRRVVERGDAEELQELFDYHEMMLGAGQEDDRHSMATINYRFHRRINQLARSPKLIAVLRTHALSIPREFIAELPHWVQRANEQHAQILQVVAERDAVAAERLMRDHVMEAGNDLIAYLESHGVELS